MKKSRIFELAEMQSELSDFKGQRDVHLGAVIMYKNKPISFGYNTLKSSPIQKKYNKFRFNPDEMTAQNGNHAETSALLSIKKAIEEGKLNPSKIEIYVFRQRKSGKTANACPCKGCQQMLKDFGIKKIFYTLDCPEGVKENYGSMELD